MARLLNFGDTHGAGQRVAAVGRAFGAQVGLGKVIPDGITGEAMLKEIGADWTVSLEPVALANHADVGVPKTYAVCRDMPDGTKVPFGNGRCVGKGFNPFQNHELAEFAETLGMKFEAGGVLNEGAMVWLQARVPDAAVEIRQTELGSDKVEPFLFLITAHNGTMSTVARFTSHRLFCNNQIPGLLGNAGIMRVPHTRNQRKRIEAAQRIVATEMGLFEEHVREMKALDAIEMSQNEMRAFAEKLIGETQESIAEAERTIGAVQQRNRIELRDRAVDLMRGGLGNVGRTAFDAYQGVVELVDHHFKRGSDAARFRALLGDQGDRDLKHRARQLLLRTR